MSKDVCLVPAGWGLSSINPLIAEKCKTNTYGDDKNRTAVANARCTPCPAGMMTMDVLDGGRNLNDGELYTSELACLVPEGWGTTNTLPQQW